MQITYLQYVTFDGSNTTDENVVSTEKDTKAYQFSLKNGASYTLVVITDLYVVRQSTEVFLTLTEGYREKELEDALTNNITKFLLELGQGFAYIGRQQPIMIGQKEMAMDLLFYHMKLRCYVVIDLKVGEFDASYTSQIGTYVVAVNHQLKTEMDNPSQPPFLKNSI